LISATFCESDQHW